MCRKGFVQMRAQFIMRASPPISRDAIPASGLRIPVRSAASFTVRTFPPLTTMRPFDQHGIDRAAATAETAPPGGAVQGHERETPRASSARQIVRLEAGAYPAHLLFANLIARAPPIVAAKSASRAVGRRDHVADRRQARKTPSLWNKILCVAAGVVSGSRGRH